MKTRIPTIFHAFIGLVCAGAVSLLSGVASATLVYVFPYSGTTNIITLPPGCYDIAAYGAQGGNAYLGYGNGGGNTPCSSGGLGAKMEGQFHVTAATPLTLLVGGAGDSTNPATGGGGGGGGGSFVVNGNLALVVAGGGGGGGFDNNGGNGLTGTSGSSGGYIAEVPGGYAGYGSGGASGGSSGNGGSGGSDVQNANGYEWDGGGGGGVYGNGAAGINGGGYGTGGAGGISFLNGGAGGNGGYTSAGGPNLGPGANGGFGGGGGAALYGGGGGGGWSGGGGGADGNNGGGGGSFIGSSTTATLTATLSEISGVASPDDSPNGEIIIVELTNGSCAPCLTFDCPSNIVTFTSSCTNVPVTFPLPTVTDNCCSTLFVKYSTPGQTLSNPSFFAPNTVTPVTCTVGDICGNTNSCVFTVTVLSGTNFPVQSPTNILVFSCTNVAVFYPDLTFTNPCCTNKVVFDPTNGSTFAAGTASPVTWSVYDCSSTNLLSSGTFWVSVFCSNCCNCTNYTNYTVAIFQGTNYLGDWLCQGTNNTLADVLPSVAPGTEVYFWNPTLEQFITPPDTFTSGQWQNGTEPLFPAEGFLLVSPVNTNLTIYGCIPGCFSGCTTLACDTTLFIAGTGLSPVPYDIMICGAAPPAGTDVQEPPVDSNTNVTGAGLDTYSYNGISWSPNTPPDLPVGYAEFVVTPPCPTNPVPVWTGGTNGSWSNTANWINNLVPNGTGVIANFAGLTLFTNYTVILDTHVTIGGLLFGDQGNLYKWTLADGGAGPLTLDNGTSVPFITVINQTATITAVIAGTNGLSKYGEGTLILAGANTYSGPTTVNEGTLQLDQPSLAAGSTLIVAGGGNLNLNFAGTNIIAGLLVNGVSQPPGVYNSLTSPGYLTGTGNLLVAATTATNPTRIVVSLSGDLLNLSWPADHTGWRLLVQTNHLSGISANTNDWSTVSGSTSTNQVQLPILPTQPREFYRLVYP